MSYGKEMRFIPKVAIRFWQREWILGNGRMESGKWWRVNLVVLYTVFLYICLV